MTTLPPCWQRWSGRGEEVRKHPKEKSGEAHSSLPMSSELREIARQDSSNPTRLHSTTLEVVDLINRRDLDRCVKGL